MNKTIILVSYFFIIENGSSWQSCSPCYVILSDPPVGSISHEYPHKHSIHISSIPLFFHKHSTDVPWASSEKNNITADWLWLGRFEANDASGVQDQQQKRFATDKDRVQFFLHLYTGMLHPRLECHNYFIDHFPWGSQLVLVDFIYVCCV